MRLGPDASYVSTRDFDVDPAKADSFRAAVSAYLPGLAGATLIPDYADDVVTRLDHIDQYFRGKEKALRLLALRARTRHELDTALTGIGVGDAVRGGLLSELEERGLIDDLKFTREYVRVKTEVKLLGSR